MKAKVAWGTIIRMLIGFVMTLFLTDGLNATEVAGVKFSDETSMDPDGQLLVLNGIGVRKKYFVSIYVAGLYLTDRSSAANYVIKMESPKRLVMQIIYSEITKEKFVAGWNEGFEANHSTIEMNDLRGRLDTFNAYFETMHAGDQVVFDYIPGIGTRIMIRNKAKGTIQGVEFFQALLRVWLGDQPVTASLKHDLLGH